jgi:hypothetical protein
MMGLQGMTCCEVNLHAQIYLSAVSLIYENLEILTLKLICIWIKMASNLAFCFDFRAVMLAGSYFVDFKEYFLMFQMHVNT